MLSVSVLVVLVIATILGITNVQGSYTNTLLAGINRQGPIRGHVGGHVVEHGRPVVHVGELGGPIVGPRRRQSLVGAISSSLRNVARQRSDRRNNRMRGGRQQGAWGQQDSIIQNKLQNVNQIDLQYAIQECEEQQQCPRGFRCVLNEFQDGLECYDEHSGQYSDVVPRRHLQRNIAGFGQGFNDGLNPRTGVLVGGRQNSMAAWSQAACCLKSRPSECIPRIGYGRSAVRPNMISHDFWTFDNNQCRRQPILKTFVDRIGANEFGNFYPSENACYDKCDRPHLRTMYASCYQARPTACIPPVGCQQNLIARDYFRYDVDSRACVQTSLLRDHVRFINNRDGYSNFFTDRNSCLNTCPQNAWEYQNY